MQAITSTEATTPAEASTMTPTTEGTPTTLTTTTNTAINHNQKKTTATTDIANSTTNNTNNTNTTKKTLRIHARELEKFKVKLQNFQQYARHVEAQNGRPLTNEDILQMTREDFVAFVMMEATQHHGSRSVDDDDDHLHDQEKQQHKAVTPRRNQTTNTSSTKKSSKNKFVYTILGHEGPLGSTHERHAGSKYNVHVLKTDTTTDGTSITTATTTSNDYWIPLKDFLAEDAAAVTAVAEYAISKNLLQVTGWGFPQIRDAAKKLYVSAARSHSRRNQV